MHDKSQMRPTSSVVFLFRMTRILPSDLEGIISVLDAQKRFLMQRRGQAARVPAAIERDVAKHLH